MSYTGTRSASIVFLATLLITLGCFEVMASPNGDASGLISARHDVDGSNPDVQQCHFSEKEAVIRELLLSNPHQQREELECDPRLMEYARMRAEDMAGKDYFGHVSEQGIGPNEMLRNMGYELPDYYVGGRSNSIESILGGNADPKRVWEMLLDSHAHRIHLLGEADMFRWQRKFGIAHVFNPNTAHRDYWVIVIAEPRNPSQRPMTCTPPPSICIVH